MGKFLAFKRNMVLGGDLSPRTLGDYIYEVERFVAFLKPGTPIQTLKPEHFAAYMRHMVGDRKLGRYARRRVLTYINTLLRYGAKNGWYVVPNTGTDWVAPATDPDAMRIARQRAGEKDYSGRILSGNEIDRLLERSQPAFRAMILLGANCGLGPADLGRLRWSHIDLKNRRLVFPRPKTGALRIGGLWKKTCKALERVRALKLNRKAIATEGDAALVFITRKGLPYYRETEVLRTVEVNGYSVKKLVGVRVDSPIIRTFGRMVKDLKLEGVSFYRLRHTFKTLGKRARDRETLDLMMGHKDSSIGKLYDHEEISWKRVRRVTRIVYRRLWPQRKQESGAIPQVAHRTRHPQTFTPG
jgi:integrase